MQDLSCSDRDHGFSPSSIKIDFKIGIWWWLYDKSIAGIGNPWPVTLCDLTWPRTLASVRSDHLESQVAGPHFLLLTSQRVDNCIILCLGRYWWPTKPTKNRGRTQVLCKSKKFLLNMWHPSCCFCYKPGDKSRVRKGPGSDYDKRNKFVIQTFCNG